MVTEPSIVLSHNNQNINCYFVIFQVRRTWKRVRNFVNVLIGSHNVTEEFVTSFFLLYVSLRKFVSSPSPHDNDTRKSSSSSLKSSFKEWVEIYDLDMEGEKQIVRKLFPPRAQNEEERCETSQSVRLLASQPLWSENRAESFSEFIFKNHPRSSLPRIFSLFNFSLVIGEQE